MRPGEPDARTAPHGTVVWQGTIGRLRPRALRIEHPCRDRLEHVVHRREVQTAGEICDVVRVTGGQIVEIPDPATAA